MNAENFAFNNCTNSKVVENFGTVFPWVGVTILTHGLFIESVDGSDSTSLMVSSQESNAVWILQLEAEEKLESLN